MKAHWRKLAALLPHEFEKKVYRYHFRSLHETWAKKNKILPPSHLSKQELIKHYAIAYDVQVLVETGTYLGDMVYAMQDQFQQIFSIELSPHFYQQAVDRFKNFKKVKILEGDSGRVLKDLVPKLKGEALFWLDGHYSGGLTAKGDKECPIYDELTSILSSPSEHVVIIDDARLFVGKDDYPTIEELQKFVLKTNPYSKFCFKNDAIIITRK